MIAVTAGKQQISKDVIRALSEKGYPIKVLVTSVNQLQAVKNQFSNVPIDYTVGNLLDIAILEDFLNGVETVIHLDEMVSFYPNEKNEMYLHNVQGTANVVNVSLYHQVKRIIYLSTVWALGEKSDEIHFNESAKWVNVKNAKGYGWSKHLAEREIWRGVNEGLEAIILNAGYVTKNITTDASMCNLLGYLSSKHIFPEGNLTLLEMEDLLPILLEMIEGDTTNEQYVLSNGTVTFKSIIERLVAQNEKSKLKPITTNDLNQRAKFRKMANWLSGSKYNSPNKLEVKVLSDKRFFDNSKIKAVSNHTFIEKEISLQHLIENYRLGI